MYYGYLEVTSHWAAILTALVAVVAYARFVCDSWTKRRKLEHYLRDRKTADARVGKLGQRSLLHLIAKLGMTEQELLNASFKSKKIARRLGKDTETGLANVLFLEYDDGRSS